MKVKDLEKISCLDCPFRREGYCTQPDDPVCAELDEDTDIDNWLAEAEEIQHQHELRLERQAQKEREIQAEKERKRKLRKEQNAYCAKELEELNSNKKLLRDLENAKENAEYIIKADDVFTECFGIQLRQARCKEIVEKAIKGIEVIKKILPEIEKKYKDKVKEFKELKRSNE